MGMHESTSSIDRKYTVFNGEEYILDVISKGDDGSRLVIAEELSTGRVERGNHKSDETLAIDEALNKF